MTLREATRHILDSDDPLNWLELADMYIGSYNQMPDSFVLPAEHAVLQSVIAGFHSDMDAFADYIRAIRDQYPPGDDKVKLHGLYRTVFTRQVQKARRQRVQKAIEQVERALNRKLEYDEWVRVTAKLEQYWAKRRREFLKSQRALTAKGRLSTDVQNTVLKQFWAEINAEIDRGCLPIFNL